jgi:hypothetical protein
MQIEEIGEFDFGTMVYWGVALLLLEIPTRMIRSIKGTGETGLERTRWLSQPRSG